MRRPCFDKAAEEVEVLVQLALRPSEVLQVWGDEAQVQKQAEEELGQGLERQVHALEVAEQLGVAFLCVQASSKC
jgi:hypothetical protein